MPNLVPQIILSDIVIRQDAEGRYCLNDLHRAAGGEARHRPNYWLNNQQTQELIKELSVAVIPATDTVEPIVTIQGGPPSRQGTFAVKELVYAYAMWVSPAFHLKVIRTFDKVVTETLLPPPPPPMTPVQIGAQAVTEMMKIALQFNVPPSYAMQIASQAAARLSGMPEWPQMMTHAACMSHVPDEEVLLEPTDLGKLFGLNPRQMNRWLAEHGLQERVAGQWVPTEAGRGLAVRHAWSSQGKTGYNYKWRAAEIERIFKD